MMTYQYTMGSVFKNDRLLDVDGLLIPILKFGLVVIASSLLKNQMIYQEMVRGYRHTRNWKGYVTAEPNNHHYL